jgi:type VI secretion system protein ImpL
VYLLLTQVDRLPGVSALWTRVASEQCQAPWGASWQERAPEGGSLSVRFAAEWELLGRALHARLLSVLARAGAPAAAQLFELSAGFAALGERLERHVEQLTHSHPCRPRVALRGFYLCTAQPPCQHSQRSGWFFDQLFERAILADRGSVRWASHVLLRARRLRRCRWAVLLAAGALGALPAVASHGINRELVESSARTLQAAQPAPEPPGARSEQGAELTALLAQLQKLEGESQRWRVRGWWGPYLAPELERRLARRYRERLRAMMQGPIHEQLRAELRAVGDVVRFDWHNFRQAADTLKLYLMLAEPARLDPGWAAARLLHSWQRAHERGACGAQGSLEPHVERWLQALAADASLALPAADALVASVRARLLRLPVPELGLAHLAELARSVPPVTSARVFDASAARSWQVPLEARVPGLYTRAGWELLRPALSTASFSAADAWIFSQPLPPSWSSEGLQQLHLKRHAAAWRTFLLQLGAAARAPRAGGAATAWGERDTLERIQVAAQPDAPLPRLFLLLAQNLQLAMEPAAALSQQVVGALKESLGTPTVQAASLLEHEFAGLLAFAFTGEERSAIAPGSALAEYQRELRALAASLPAASTAGATPGVPPSVSLERVAATVERLLGTLNRPDRELLEGLLLAPIDEGLAQLRASEQRRLAELWRVQVVQPLQQLAQRFPFRPGASEDVELEELQALLGPQSGALWRLLEQELPRRVRESAAGFELAAPSSGEVPFSPALAPCLRAARELRQLLFAVAGVEPVSVRLSSSGGRAAALSLTVDGQRLEPPEHASSTGEESWLPLSWPGKAGPAGAVIQLRTGAFADELQRTGSFGWLRLLEEGGLRAIGRAGGLLRWEASWQLQHGATRVTLELRAPDGARVPGLGPFRALQCPAELFGSRPGGPA